jgi:pimeloyl-ACP methyl ester carboxylesterase
VLADEDLAALRRFPEMVAMKAEIAKLEFLRQIVPAAVGRPGHDRHDGGRVRVARAPRNGRPRPMTTEVPGYVSKTDLEPALMLKRTIPTAGLAVLPRTGHTANLEEPDVFNRAVDIFLGSVARGSWHPRDPRSRSASTTGMT